MTVNRQPSTTNYQLPITNYQLPITHYQILYNQRLRPLISASPLGK
ncbi:hypothetical protein IQ272_19770 [Chroococcidiopsidales cyanobacterium LEGE 13417]|nr:hypothetical protein [Chroococcidiopsidales cyanobacterium LEGE 13417]